MPVNDVALTRKRQAQLAALRTTIGGQLLKRWNALGSYDTEGAWVKAATPILTAGQNRAISLQTAYLAAVLGETIIPDRAAILEAAAIDVAQPFIAYANALSKGSSLEAAIESGALRAEGVGESGVQWAARAANQSVEGNPKIVGWTRTLGPNACDWCIQVAGQQYRTAESASFGHLRDDCGVDPIIGDRDPGRVLNTSR